MKEHTTTQPRSQGFFSCKKRDLGKTTYRPEGLVGLGCSQREQVPQNNA